MFATPSDWRLLLWHASVSCVMRATHVVQRAHRSHKLFTHVCHIFSRTRLFTHPRRVSAIDTGAMHCLLFLRQKAEGHAMVNGRSVRTDGVAMIGSGVALVSAPSIRIVPLQAAHPLVPLRLRQDRCCGHLVVFRVRPRFEREWHLTPWTVDGAIDQNVRHRHIGVSVGEIVKSSVEHKAPRLAHPELIDFGCRHGADADAVLGANAARKVRAPR